MRTERTLTLDRLLAEARARVAAQTPAEREAMLAAQRESWARGMAPCEHGVSDFEDCDRCRAAARARLARRSAEPT